VKKSDKRPVYEDRTEKIKIKKGFLDSEANIALLVMLAFMVGLHLYTRMNHRNELYIVKGKGF